MEGSVKLLYLIAGDVVVFFLSLAGRIVIRSSDVVWDGLVFFVAVTFVVWSVTYHFLGLFDLRALRNSYDVIRLTATATAWSTCISILFFYVLPLPVTPKVNLVLFTVIFFVLDSIWRVLFHVAIRKPNRRVLVVGDAPEIGELIAFLRQNPQVGYEVVEVVPELPYTDDVLFKSDLERRHINTVFIQISQFDKPENRKKISLIFSAGFEVRSIETVIEILLKKIVILQSSSYQLMQIISMNQKIYGTAKRIAE